LQSPAAKRRAAERGRKQHGRFHEPPEVRDLPAVCNVLQEPKVATFFTFLPSPLYRARDCFRIILGLGPLAQPYGYGAPLLHLAIVSADVIIQ
jgi:hypothetical protein